MMEGKPREHRVEIGSCVVYNYPMVVHFFEYNGFNGSPQKRLNVRHHRIQMYRCCEFGKTSLFIRIQPMEGKNRQCW